MKSPISTSLVLLVLSALFAIGEAGEGKAVDRFFSPQELRRIRSDGALKRVYEDENIPESVPLPPELQAEWNGYLAVVKGYIPSRASLLDCANLFLDVSSLAGLQYYSVTDERRQTLIEDAYTVKGPESVRRIADPVLDTLPARTESYFFQKDNRSDGLIYRSVIRRFEDGTLVFTTANVTETSQFLVFRIHRGDAWQMIRLFPAEGGYYYFALMRAITPRLMPFASTFSRSIVNRADAFLGHYQRRISESGLRNAD
jgi:hypothetical protein